MPYVRPSSGLNAMMSISHLDDHRNILILSIRMEVDHAGSKQIKHRMAMAPHRDMTRRDDRPKIDCSSGMLMRDLNHADPDRQSMAVSAVWH